MFCKYCGCEIDGDAVICTHCGAPTDKFYDESRPETKPTNGLAIAGLVLGILGLLGGYLFCIIPAVGIVLSALGLKNSRETRSGHGTAVAGLAVSITATVIWLLVWIILGAVLISSFSAGY